jgi:hypothetical protein
MDRAVMSARGAAHRHRPSQYRLSGSDEQRTTEGLASGTLFALKRRR